MMRSRWRNRQPWPHFWGLGQQIAPPRWTLAGVLMVLLFGGNFGCRDQAVPATTQSDVAPETPSPSPVPDGGIELPPIDELENSPVPSSQTPGGIELPDFEMSSSDPQSGPKETGSASDERPESDSQNLGIPLPQSSIEVQSWYETLAAVQGSGIHVVDLWSLSCPPCMAEFPGLVRLHRKMGDQVHCLAVSVDFDGRKSRPPEYYRERITAFLDSVDSGSLPAVICSTPSDEVLGNVQADSIPTVLVFQDGKLVDQFVDAGRTLGFSYESDVTPLIERLARSSR